MVAQERVRNEQDRTKNNIVSYIYIYIYTPWSIIVFISETVINRSASNFNKKGTGTKRIARKHNCVLYACCNTIQSFTLTVC